MLKKLAIYVCLVGLVLGLIAAGVGYWVIYAPNTLDYEGKRGVKIPRGAGFAQVLDSLEANNILDSRRTLAWLGRATGWDEQLDAGFYRIESGASNYDILDKIRRGLQDPVHVTIPPGSRPEVVAAVAARDMAFPADSFLTALRDTALAHALGTDTTHLFGYLMPETYYFYWLTPAEDVIRRAKEQFDEFYTEEMAARADSLRLTKAEVATLASIIQWETAVVEEKDRIAGVYLNRLEIGMALQADPTIQYAILQEEGQTRRLFFSDYEIAHPYNTYNYRGLPPGPITNPSASSIRAVLNAEEHGYLYFVASPGGGHYFSETYSEHLRAADRYYEAMREQRQAQEDGAE